MVNGTAYVLRVTTVPKFNKGLSPIGGSRRYGTSIRGPGTGGELLSAAGLARVPGQPHVT
jgi:hypothetical protein